MVKMTGRACLPYWMSSDIGDDLVGSLHEESVGAQWNKQWMNSNGGCQEDRNDIVLNPP